MNERGRARLLLRMLLRLIAVLAVAIVATYVFVLWVVFTFLWEVPRETQETLFLWVAVAEGILLVLVAVLLLVDWIARRRRGLARRRSP